MHCTPRPALHLDCWAGFDEPRSGDRLLAWGVSPRFRFAKNTKAAERRQKTKRRFLRLTPQAGICRPSGACLHLVDSLPGAHAPGYVSVAPSALGTAPHPGSICAAHIRLCARLRWARYIPPCSFRSPPSDEPGRCRSCPWAGSPRSFRARIPTPRLSPGSDGWS